MRPDGLKDSTSDLIRSNLATPFFRGHGPAVVSRNFVSKSHKREADESALFPKSAMHDDRFRFENWSDDNNTWLLRSLKSLTTRKKKVVRFDNAPQHLGRAAKHDRRDLRPVNRTATHQAGFSAGIERSFGKGRV